MRKSFVLTALLPIAVACSNSAPAPEETGINKLDHLIFVVMENRSFDHYFGTYPGADGIPRRVCVPHPSLGGRCTRPYHDTDLYDDGGPHGKPASDRDINGGRMNGFIEAALALPEPGKCLIEPTTSWCDKRVGPQLQPEIMGYHTRDEIPAYWAYADEFVLQDRMFGPTDSWTLPAHLFLVSAWSARCADHSDPMSCESALLGSEAPPKATGVALEDRSDDNPAPYAWTDITYLLNEQGVSWGYYVADPSCLVEACETRDDVTTTHQNPLPGFATVRENGQLENIRPMREFHESAADGDLPDVSWVIPAIGESDHPGHGSIGPGQAFVTKVVNAVGEGPGWESSAIFITWDDWGGFYDHVEPPRVDENGYGLRVPGLMVSPYARKGYIDHQTLTFDAYLKLIEDRFLGGERLDPKTLSRPDSRPTVREEVDKLGDLRQEFDFAQEPRPPMILDPEP
ncbi:MAG: alkaline phosphatase family protein [Actinomycetota bacterium]